MAAVLRRDNIWVGFEFIIILVQQLSGFKPSTEMLHAYFLELLFKTIFRIISEISFFTLFNKFRIIRVATLR